MNSNQSEKVRATKREEYFTGSPTPSQQVERLESYVQGASQSIRYLRSALHPDGWLEIEDSPKRHREQKATVRLFLSDFTNAAKELDIHHIWDLVGITCITGPESIVALSDKIRHIKNPEDVDDEKLRKAVDWLCSEEQFTLLTSIAVYHAPLPTGPRGFITRQSTARRAFYADRGDTISLEIRVIVGIHEDGSISAGRFLLRDSDLICLQRYCAKNEICKTPPSIEQFERGVLEAGNSLEKLDGNPLTLSRMFYVSGIVTCVRMADGTFHGQVEFEGKGVVQFRETPSGGGTLRHNLIGVDDKFDNDLARLAAFQAIGEAREKMRSEDEPAQGATSDSRVALLGFPVVVHRRIE